MFYSLLFVFAILPSLIWLLYYLKKDVHPEPKRLILYVFFAGAFAAIVGYFFQAGASGFINVFIENLPHLLFLGLLFQKFIIIAFSEEFLKYLAFFFTMRGHQDLDEPVDFIIYMITAAMGFAAAENLILFSSLGLNITFGEVLQISLLRFMSATFLHALASGILGVFIVYACRFSKRSLLFYGLITVTFLHGIYNILVTRVEDISSVFLLALFLIILSFVLSRGIKKVKKMRSVCVLRDIYKN